MTDEASVPADAPRPPITAKGASGEPGAVPRSIEPGLRELPEDPRTAGLATAPTGLDAAGRPWPSFAHGSEAEMARILDFYEVRWDYEPRTFPILWNLDGDVVESFSPDFYLPDLDLYLEMTTLKQRLVRKKNRKLRRLRELYPAIRIKLFYARDFRAMLLKYGRLALADSMSGTLGQVMPDRLRDDLELEIEGDLAGDGDPLAVAAASAPTSTSAATSPGEAERPRAVPRPSSAAPERAGTPVASPAPGLGSSSAATGGPETGTRRNASRSRRRRAAAAARRASRSADATTSGASVTQGRHTDEEDESRP